MEKWTPSSAEEEMAGDATPNYGKGFSDAEEGADQSDPDPRPWHYDRSPTPPEEEAQDAEEVALAAVPQQQLQEANGRGPGLSSGPQNEPDSPVEHQLPAYH